MKHAKCRLFPPACFEETSRLKVTSSHMIHRRAVCAQHEMIQQFITSETVWVKKKQKKKTWDNDFVSQII